MGAGRTNRSSASAAPPVQATAHPVVTGGILFITWFLEKEQQAKFTGWPVRADVAPPAGLKPIFRYILANNYADFVSDETRLAELRKCFEGYTGPVKNIGGCVSWYMSRHPNLRSPQD